VIDAKYQMKDYLRSALHQISRLCPDWGSGFRGYCLWAYRPDEAASLPGGDAQVTPASPSSKIYGIINFPPCR